MGDNEQLIVFPLMRLQHVGRKISRKRRKAWKSTR